MTDPIYFLTGLPASGKTTIAKELTKKLSATLIDGDTLRKAHRNTDFSWEGRKKNMLYAADLAYGLSNRRPVVVSLISPVRSTRDKIKKVYENVIEVYVKCSLNECIKRDFNGRDVAGMFKSLYAEALRGKITEFTGISSPYEAPLEPDIIVDTEEYSLEECVKQIMEFTR